MKFGTNRMVIALLIGAGIVVPAHAGLRFDDRASSITVKDGCIMHVDSEIYNWDGTLVKTTNDYIEGEDINFEKGILECGTSEALLTGVYKPSGTDVIWLQGNHRLRAEPGTVVQELYIDNTQNWVEGQPLFLNDPGIIFDNQDAILNIAIQNELNKDINLADARLVLQDHLNLADPVRIWPTGIVDLNNRTLSMPGADNTWSSTLTFVNATDITLNAKTTLVGMWTFTGSDAYLNGNGNILDLATTGTLFVEDGVTLHLVDVILKGLGETRGTILLDGPDSKLYLHNAKIVLSDSYSVTQGSWYVEGADSTIITANHVLSFVDGTDSIGTMTVDGVTLWYDTLQYGDAHNVYPSEAFDATHNPDGNITWLNSGLIKNTEVLGFEGDIVIELPNDSLQKNHDITLYHKLVFKKLDDDDPVAGVKDIELDGNGYALYFPHTTGTFIDVQDNVHALIKNTVLKNFNPSHVVLGTNSDIYFGDGVILELDENQEVATGDATIKVFGSIGEGVVIHGKGNMLKLSKATSVQVDSMMTVSFKDITLTGLDGSEISCIDNTGVVDLLNVTFDVDDRYTFAQGILNIFEDTTIRTRKPGTFGCTNNVPDGNTTGIFAYTSPADLTIKHSARLLVDRGVTFSWDSSGGQQNLFIGGSLYLNGCQLYVTTTGLELRKENDDTRLIVEEDVQFTSDADYSTTDFAIKLDSDLSVDVLAGAVWEICGPLVYEAL